MFDNLKTCVFGGYNKMETLKYIDNLNNEIYMLETALENKNEGKEYTIPVETVPARLKNAALGGFNKRDIDVCTGDLRSKILELRRKLGMRQ